MLGNMYRFSCRACTYFAYSHGFVFQGKLNYILGVYEERTIFKLCIYCMKIDVDLVFCHAVPLRTILSVTAQSVCCQPHHSLTNQMRTVYNAHELTSTNHLSFPELIYRSSDHSLVSRTYSHQILNCFTGP